MGFDFRQVVAGFLTITMFVMLGHMIKRDHFDSIQVRISESSDGFSDTGKAFDNSVTKIEGAWKDESEEQLKPCWTKPDLDDVEESKGYVTFSLTNGPEYHVSQIGDAIVVARSLGATLVLPEIRGSKTDESRAFGDIYDVKKFVHSLNGVVRVAKSLPNDIGKIAAVSVPNRVTEDYIAKHVEPVYRKKGNIKLSIHFHSVNMKKSDTKGNLDSIACLGMFGTLELQPAVQEVVDSMVERLRTLSRKSDGHFVAIDLRVDILESKGCQENEANEAKSCFDGMEIAEFLQKTGFDKSTTIYLTQTVWHSSLDALKEFFPKTYTKEGIMPADKKRKFLGDNSIEYQEAINFYICAESDVFVPAISGLFYANVAGKRIAAGKTQILVPAKIPGKSAPADDFLSHYISKKNHFAYSCFC